MSDFTIAICTHNRAEHLRRCLAGLAIQAGAQGLPPLVIVDNACTDDTRDVVAEFPGLQPQLVREERLGLSHARNAALAVTSTDSLVFLDDDAIPVPGWTAAIERGLAQWQPDLFGGPYIPHYLTAKPAWYRDAYASAHAGKPEGLISSPYCFSGGNMGWKTDLLRSLGGFDPQLGMVGQQLRLGEETAIQMKLWQEQPQLRRVMLPEMLMTHYVSPEKMKLGYVWQRSFQYGRQLGQINPHDPLWQRASCTRTLLRCKFGLPLLARFLRDTLTGSERWKGYAADWMSLFAIHFGAAWERKAL